MSRVDKFWTMPMYDESGCQKCPFAVDRPVDQCYEGCTNFKGALKLYDTWKSKSGTEYVKLPPGNLNRIENLLRLDPVKIRDKRPKIKFDYPIKVLWDLYDGKVVNGKKTVDQKKLVEEWFEANCSGIIQAPPRAGKTITSIKALIATGCKFIVVAHESRLLKQFYATLMGDAKKKIPAATNLPKLEKKTGKVLCKVIDNVKKDLIDNDDLQIALVTYQKFIKDKTAIKRIKILNERFSGFIIDECHQSSAFSYLKFLSRLTMRYRLGLSATPKRKDGLDKAMVQFIGPVVARAITVALTPRIELVETGVTTGKYSYRSWVGAMKFLGNNKDRNKLIVREIFKDLRNGRQGIIIPVDYKDVGNTIVDLLNKQARINNRKRNEKWPTPFAAFYHSKAKESGILEEFDAGNIKVLVGIRSMIKQGIDMQIPDCLYMVIPMSADKSGRAGAPIFEQLSYRVATWTPTKKDPCLKLFIDGLSFSTGCFRGLWWKEILPGLKARNGKPAKYRIKDADFKRAMQIAGDRNYVPVNSPGEIVTSEKVLAVQSKKRNDKSMKYTFKRRD